MRGCSNELVVSSHVASLNSWIHKHRRLWKAIKYESLSETWKKKSKMANVRWSVLSIIPIPLLVFIILLILLLDSVLIWTLLTTTTALSIKKPQDAIPVIEVFLATLFCLAVCVNLITTQTIARNQEQPIEIVKKVDVTYSFVVL